MLWASTTQSISRNKKLTSIGQTHWVYESVKINENLGMLLDLHFDSFNLYLK